VSLASITPPAIMMDVSIVIPTHNRCSLLALTLQSALWQRDVAFEVIVVDDGSSDGTAAMLADLRDSRVRTVRHDTPQGVSAARNRGLSEARAEWIAFLDDDDLWAPEKLTMQLMAVRQQQAAWVYVGHVNINLRHRVTGGEPPLAPDALLTELRRRNVVPGGCSGVVVSRRTMEAAGGFDPHLQPLADWDLWLRLAQAGTPACVARPLVAYRVHGTQMSLDAARVEAEFRILADRYGEASAAVLYRYLGWWALRVRNHREAARYFVRGALQFRSDYRPSSVATDLAALARNVLEHRLRISLPSTSAPPSAPLQEWRREGQAWVDRLVKTAGATAPIRRANADVPAGS
jgi:GT2 family glycosyltransferase